MRSEIKEQIEQIRCSEVPNGYIRIHGSIIPDDWGVESIGRLMTPVKKKAGEGQYQVLSITAGKGFVSQAEKFGKDISGKQYAQYTVIKNGDFSYNKGNSKTYAQGCIYLLEDWEEAAVPNVFNSFRPKSKKIIPEYYKHLFINGYLNKQLYRYINSGVRNDGLLNLYDEDFYSCLLPVPPSIEQSKIAEILTHCDKVISLKQQLIEEKKKQKKWLMQNLLDPDSRVRLPGFEGDWKQGVIADAICELVAGTSVNSIDEETDYSKEFMFVLKTSAISNGNLDLTQIKQVIYDDYTRVSCQLSKDCLLISRMNTPALVGACAYSDTEIGNIFLPDRLWKAMPSNNEVINMKWLNYVLNQKSYKDIIRKNAGGTSNSMKNISQDNFLRIPLSYPSVEEQTAIANVLTIVDREIELFERDFGQWQLKKKSLMQLLLTGIVRVEN